jgi:hypothetical protein
MALSTKIIGFLTLFIGVAVLLFTFYSAYQFLLGVFVAPSSGDLARSFTDALTPLITACIRAIYLGIMGWVGGLITRRGVQVIVGEKEEKGKEKIAKEEVKEVKEGKQEAK